MKVGIKKLFALLAALAVSLLASLYLSFTLSAPSSLLTALTVSLTAGAGTAHASDIAESAPVRFMSYNIRHGEGLDNRLALSRTADVIRGSNAEIVALQEVDKFWAERSGFADQAKELADMLGMHYAFSANLDYAPAKGQTERRQYGTAILSKHPIVGTRSYPLPKIESSSEARGLLEATIDVGGRQITVYCTHMSINAGERVVQIKELVKIAAEKEGPAVFMGDFNAKPNTFEMRPLFKKYKEAFQGKKNAFTAPAAKPENQIDYILYNDWFELAQSEIIQSNASDHLPVYAELNLKTK